MGAGAGGGVEEDEVFCEKEVGEEAEEQGLLVQRSKEEGPAHPSSDLASSFTHLQINVATMEERGLEAAEREAKASRKLRRR